MITITKTNRELYIAVDYPTPNPEIPSLLDGQVFKLYEYTYTGPKYIGTYMVKTGEEFTEIGPLRIAEIAIKGYEIHYRGYHQYIELKDYTKCYGCTPEERFTEQLKKLIFTDDEQFFRTVLNTTTDPYNYISYVDGILTIGNQIRRVDNTTIKPIIEDDTIYYVEIDESTIPPRETARTKIITLPFRIRNGTIKKLKFHENKVRIEVHYPGFKLAIRMSTFSGKITRIEIEHGKKKDEITLGHDGNDASLMPIIINTIDEHGLEGYEFIKNF